ncbi:hypothetical protein ElyMa_003038000, partial [Elysia marginata]
MPKRLWKNRQQNKKENATSFITAVKLISTLDIINNGSKNQHQLSRDNEEADRVKKHVEPEVKYPRMTKHITFMRTDCKNMLTNY